MFFSVIIPLYNKAPYVAKAIQSVLCQSFSDFELVIIDDGSRDGSAEIAAQLIEGREHCQLVKQENAGVSIARNNGVAVSKGEYLCFLDADDWWGPTFLEEMSRLIYDFPDAGIYGTNYTIVNETKRKTRVAQIGVEEGFEKGYINYCQAYAKTMYMPLWTGAVCIPRRIFEEMGGFSKDIKLGEDFLLWLHIVQKHKVAFLNKPLSYYNQDVDVSIRETRKKKYDPDSFMTFHLEEFQEEESKNRDLKLLLDRIRVYSLLNFRQYNLYPDRVKNEIAKVNFSNVNSTYRFVYNAPFLPVHIFFITKRFLSALKQAIIK